MKGTGSRDVIGDGALGRHIQMGWELVASEVLRFTDHDQAIVYYAFITLNLKLVSCVNSLPCLVQGIIRSQVVRLPRNTPPGPRLEV